MSQLLKSSYGAMHGVVDRVRKRSSSFIQPPRRLSLQDDPSWRRIPRIESINELCLDVDIRKIMMPIVVSIIQIGIISAMYLNSRAKLCDQNRGATVEAFFLAYLATPSCCIYAGCTVGSIILKTCKLLEKLLRWNDSFGSKAIRFFCLCMSFFIASYSWFTYVAVIGANAYDCEDLVSNFVGFTLILELDKKIASSVEISCDPIDLPDELNETEGSEISRFFFLFVLAYAMFFYIYFLSTHDKFADWYCSVIQIM